MNKCLDCDWNDYIIGTTSDGVKIYSNAFKCEKIIEKIDECEKYTNNKRIEKEDYLEYDKRKEDKKLAKRADRNATIALIISVITLIISILAFILKWTETKHTSMQGNINQSQQINSPLNFAAEDGYKFV